MWLDILVKCQIHKKTFNIMFQIGYRKDEYNSCNMLIKYKCLMSFQVLLL